jgi:4-amino-4-deoxy-L-arabinose transferase-like glycosyltransferase
VLFGSIGLAPDEAHYWLWSEELDIGYYSKPPLVAYVIKAGTLLFGNSELGVRFFFILLSLCLPCATYLLAKNAGVTKQQALFAVLIIAFCPIGILSGFAATTDIGFVLFWTLAFAELAFSLHNRVPPSFWRVALYMMIAALFKWTAYLIFVPIFIGICYYPLWRTKGLWWLLMGALVAFFPAFYWNWTHQFVTFKHVAGQVGNSAAPNPMMFFLAQVGLLFPTFFLAALITIQKLPHLSKALRFVAGSAAFFFLIYWGLSFTEKMQANWIIYIYPLLAVAAAVSISKKNLIISLAISISLSFILFSGWPIDPFKETRGLSKLPSILKNAGYDPQNDVLLSDRYQTSSLISFYSEEQKRAYFLNILPQRQNQFFFWPVLKEGASGYFVGITQKEEVREEEKLLLYFEKVGPAQVFPLIKDKKWVYLIAVQHYNGKIPPGVLNY